MTHDPYGHPAIRKACEIWDRRDERGRLADLNHAEQEFLTAVELIRNELARTTSEAAKLWGHGSRAYDATAFLAKRSHDEALTRTLEAFEARDDEALEIEADDTFVLSEVA